MASGIKYDLNPLETERELWNQDTTYRMAGGFVLDDADLPAGYKLPPLAPIVVDFKTRKAAVAKNVKVLYAVAASDTSVRVQKGSLAYVGMILGTGTAGATVSAIDKSNPDFDTITLQAAFGASISVGKVLFEAGAAGGTTVKRAVNALNYAWTKVEEGATLTAIGQAYEIKEGKLYLPISDKDKATLTSRFMFV